jgi:hypothetical protein
MLFSSSIVCFSTGSFLCLDPSLVGAVRSGAPNTAFTVLYCTTYSCHGLAVTLFLCRLRTKPYRVEHRVVLFAIPAQYSKIVLSLHKRVFFSLRSTKYSRPFQTTQVLFSCSLHDVVDLPLVVLEKSTDSVDHSTTHR